MLVCVATFDELGVDGVYNVMKAERLSRKKSLTEGVALSLAEYAPKFDGFTGVYAGRFFLSLVANLFEEGGIPALCFSADELYDE